MFTQSNLAVSSPERPRKGGKPKPREMKKWKFYSTASEEMMKYVNNEENKNFVRVQTETPIHNPTTVPNNYHTNIPTFIFCSLEEGVMRRVK